MSRLRDTLSDVYHAFFTDKGRASGGRPEARVMGPEQRQLRQPSPEPLPGLSDYEGRMNVLQQLQADPDMYPVTVDNPVMGPRQRPPGLGLVSPQYMTNEFGTIYNHNGHYLRLKPDEYVVDGPNGEPVVLKRY